MILSPTVDDIPIVIVTVSISLLGSAILAVVLVEALVTTHTVGPEFYWSCFPELVAEAGQMRR